MQMAYLKQILIKYFICSPTLTINKEGTMKYPSININIENYIIFQMGNDMIKYETAECEFFTMLLFT